MAGFMTRLFGGPGYRSPYDLEDGRLPADFKEFQEICEPKRFNFQLVGSTILALSGIALLTTSIVFSGPVLFALPLIAGSIFTAVGFTILAGSCVQSRSLCSCLSNFFRKKDDDMESMLRDAGLSLQTFSCCSR